MDSSVSSGTDNASSNQMRNGGAHRSHANSGTTATPTQGASGSKSSGLLTRVKVFFKRISGIFKPSSKGAAAPSQFRQVHEEAKVDRETIE